MYGVAENACCCPTVSRAMGHTVEKVVTMIPNRNDRSKERLGMKVLQELRSPDSARTEKKVKTDEVLMQVFDDFAEIFFRPSVEAHKGSASTGSRDSYKEAFREKVIPTAVETALKMLKKVELATEGRTPSASKTLVMNANVLFGISDNDREHKERKSAKVWTGGSVDGSTSRTGLWENLASAFIDSDGPYAKLSRMKADDITLEDAERAFMPYLSDVPKLREH